MSTEVKAPEVVEAGIEIVPYSDAHVFSPKEVSERVKAIHQIMKKLMRVDVHYGTIPGTQKPTLYKPGAEILLLTFRIAIEPEITDLSSADEVRYRVRAFGKHVPTGALAGIGVGECSSKEEKFLWREAVCREEYDETPADQKRIKYKRKWISGKPSSIKVEQIKVHPADAANAVLKRAKKRAQVDFCLTAMAASDIFTQDVEDLPDGYLNDNDSRPADPSVSPAQQKELQKLLDMLSETRKKKALAYLQVETLENLPAKKYTHALTVLTKAVKTEGDAVSEAQGANLQALIEEIGGKCQAEFLSAHKISKISELPASQYQGALLALQEKRRVV